MLLRICLLWLFLSPLSIIHGDTTRERLRTAKQILSEVPLIDAHNDLPWNIRKFSHNVIRNLQLDSDLRSVAPWSKSRFSHTDLPRMREGLLGAQFWSAFVPCDSQDKDAVQLTLEQIDLIRRFVDAYPDTLQFVTSAKEILETHGSRPRKIASLIGVEGGHSMGASLAILRTFYELGVRYMTLTHTCHTPWADSSSPGMPIHNGLTEYGKTVIQEMNRLGMMVDLSHVSSDTARAAIRESKAPVIFSHSGVLHICNHNRNLPDDVIASVKENGGIIMVNFYPNFIKCGPHATISDVAEHIHYIKNLIGAEYVGLGADFDGVNSVPRGLEDVSKYPHLFAELLRSGKWSIPELKGLAGLNFIRVMQKVEKIRDDLRTSGQTSIEQEDVEPNGKCSLNLLKYEHDQNNIVT